ncbi:hypothetical protein BST61_g6817 [Cercospora zeina]
MNLLRRPHKSPASLLAQTANMCHNIILLECDSKGDTIIKTYYPTESPLCAEAQAAGGTSHCNTRIAEACDLLAARGSIKLG